jgi:hypothetical protein
MRYEIITAINHKLHSAYGNKSLATWQTKPIIYWEGDLIDPRWDHWRQVAKSKEGKSFELTTVRFSHKIQAQIHHIRQSSADYVIWLDADVVQHTEYTQDQLIDLLPTGDEMISYLNREPVKHSETGWIAYNMQHPRIKEFMRVLEDVYLTQVIFSLKEWHDAFVWDYVRKRGNYPGRNLCRNNRAAEPFEASDLKEFFKHHKGPRKAQIK